MKHAVETNPRALYFDRIRRMGELTQYKLGHINTGAGTTTSTFPTDFTYGLAIQTSVHDVAWLILRDSTDTVGINMHNEISDTSQIRWAEPTVLPFTRTTFTKTMSRGASQSEGRATLTYVKLPGDW